MPINYIHSYDAAEQHRLVAQAAFLEPYIHPLLAFEPGDSILEIGCGVGAQIRTVLNRQKISSITGIDLSGAQISKAGQLLAREVREGLVTLVVGSGAELPFSDESFDAIYIFFVLEHFSNPGAILAEAKRVLKFAGKMYCTEVFNSGIYIYPHNQVLLDYWKQFNRLQASIGGNPDIGIQLPGYFVDAGFRIAEYRTVNLLLDKRMKSPSERDCFMTMWKTLFLSGADMLLNRGMIATNTARKVSAEFDLLRNDPQAIFEYSARQVVAVK
ncbi:MAG: methyltransferase domain-containing protein [Gallionella sp.]